MVEIVGELSTLMKKTKQHLKASLEHSFKKKNVAALLFMSCIVETVYKHYKQMPVSHTNICYVWGSNLGKIKILNLT